MQRQLKLKPAAILFVVFLLAVGSSRAQTPVTNSYFAQINTDILDDNPNGVTSTINVSGLYGTIADVSVSLNIANGYNGDLYATLTDPTGNYAVLLNRVGVGGTDWFGYGNSGFDVMFTTTAVNNIHFYQNLDPICNGSGQLTGIWAPDGRNIDPNTQVSPPSAFDAALTTSTINSSLGTDPNGNWTLFVSDMSGSFQSTWINWQLNLIGVPEPTITSLMVLGGALGSVAARRHFARRKTSRP
jgi:subtilisin-like proprotein convertase family protein